ncbi:MAG: zinc ribbon domain-containing protein [Kiritimatiellia bacterium]
MKPCRDCRREISEQALACPHCGAPCPARARWDGWGYEYKSKATLFGLPLLHVSFKFRPNRMPVPARGIVAIGQFAAGVFVLAQFGVGAVCVSQFALAGFALAQLAAAYALVAQMGLYVRCGYGQFVQSLAGLVGQF